jgi:predicted nucleic acid-binding protein
MSEPAFLDTNVVIYAFGFAGRKSERAEQLLLAGGQISAQVLNEFVSAARSKFHWEWPLVEQMVERIESFCPSPAALTADTTRLGMQVSARYGFSINDGLIVAAALQAGCRTLYSEDLQHGQSIDGLTIENPFLGL